MAIRQFEIERLCVRSSKPFATVVAALKAGVGRLDLVELKNMSKSASSFIDRDLGPTGPMLFVEFDHGAVLRKETGLDKPKIVRFVIGNPLVMKKRRSMCPTQGLTLPSQY